MLRVGGIERLPPGRGQGITITFPVPAIHLKVGLLERPELAGFVEVILQLRDMALLAMVTTELVEHFHEDLEDRRGGVASDVVGLLVDIEEDAVGGNLDRPLHAAAQNLILDVR